MSYDNQQGDAFMNIASTASNIIAGDNPAYGYDDFIEAYPGFGKDAANKEIVPKAIVEMYISLAHTCVKEARWHDYWKLGIGLFVAHFCFMYLQGTADPKSGAARVLAAGQAKGLVTSKSVEGVSINYDFSSIAQDLEGWASWTLSVYGIQFASIGKLIGKGNMLVW